MNKPVNFKKIFEKIDTEVKKLTKVVEFDEQATRGRISGKQFFTNASDKISETELEVLTKRLVDQDNIAELLTSSNSIVRNISQAISNLLKSF